MVLIANVNVSARTKKTASFKYLLIIIFVIHLSVKDTDGIDDLQLSCSVNILFFDLMSASFILELWFSIFSLTAAAQCGQAALFFHIRAVIYHTPPV
jgi:hypothetical protein